MKKLSYLLLTTALFMVSCGKKEIKLPKSSTTLVAELTDQSPIYIEKNASGKVVLNESNRIGSTHWVFCVSRDLTVGEVIPLIQKLKTKKYGSGMHSDTMNMYFVYMDTVSKQTAFLPINQYDFVFDQKEANGSSLLNFKKETSIETFIQQMTSKEIQMDSIKRNQTHIAIY